MSFDDVPPDLLFNICTFLQPKDLMPLWTSCRRMADILNEDRLWVFYTSLDFESGEFPQKKKEIQEYIHENNITWKLYYKERSAWNWSSTKKAPCLILSNHEKTVKRPDNGSNCAILASRPFSSRNNRFSARIDEYSNWIGVGFASEEITFDGSSVLGYQGGINSSYFEQDDRTTVKFAGISGRSNIDERVSPPISDGIVITIQVDFSTFEVSYFNNEQLVKTLELEPLRDSFMEGKIFPAACLGVGSQITFVPSKFIKLPPKPEKSE